jgi:alpha-1,2-mannosyltransferase
MADFRVYYDAANALLNGTPLYGKAFGVSSGFYKYSPFACVPFIPFALLPYSLASFFYYLLTTAAIIFFSLRVSSFLNKEASRKAKWALPIITGLFLIDHLERELHLGNINLILLIILFETFLLLKSNRNKPAGVLFGIVLMFKPHFLLILPYLIWKKRLKTIAATLATMLVCLLIPALALGLTSNTLVLEEWFRAMTDHNVALHTSPNTIYGLINHVFPAYGSGSLLVVTVLGIVAILFLIYVIKNDRKAGARISTGEVRYSEYFLLIGLVPNLVHTDTEHFMWVWPMLAVAIQAALKTETRYKKLFLVLLAVAFVPFAINSPDIVGTRFQHLFDEGGLGISNLLILCCAIWASNSLSSEATNP